MKRRRQELWMPSIRGCYSAGYIIEKGIPSSSLSSSLRRKGPYHAKQVTITTTSNRLSPVILFLLITILCHDGCSGFLRVQPGAHNFHSKLHTISLLRRWKQTKRTADDGTVLLLYAPDNNHDKPVDRQGLSMSMRDDDDDDITNNLRPIPAMPSDLFQQLALSQLELLANSLTLENTNDKHSNSQSSSKIKSMALYLPQENVQTGQLEFLPAVVYPHPTSERVFIASDAQSGFAPTLPKLLTQLPGFAAPNSLLPRYPMVSTSGKEAMAGVGVVEEVLCDVRSGAPALSVPLFLGSQTVGVLLVSPSVPIATKRKRESDPNTSTTNKQKRNNNNHPIWTKEDRQQIARAAQTLSMALSMDMERNSLKLQNQRVRAELSDSLHQVKNPLQALRTFGKLLQRRVADGDTASNSAGVGTTLQLLELTENLMAQSDRVVNLLAPIDSIVDSLERPQLYLNPAPDLEEPSIADNQSLVPWDQANPPSLPWETDTLEFARREVPSSKEGGQERLDDNSSTIEFTRQPRRQSFDTERQAAIQRTPKESIDESNLPTMPWETETLEFARREAPTRRKPVLVAPDETSVPVDGNNSTIEFSLTPQQTASTKQQEVRNRKELAAQPVKTAASSSQACSVVGESDELEMGFVLDVLDPILKAFAAIGEERGIDLQVLGLDQADDLPGVFMRKKSLQEAVSNVIENAFKYVVVSPDGQGRNQNPLVRFHLLANESQDKNELLGVTLVVEDNGPGVNPEEAALIFQRGFRSPATSSAVDGTGIGLGISRMLLESMGGTLECLVTNTDLDLSTKRLSGGCFRLCLFRKR